MEHALERETDGEHALHRPVADVSRQEVALFDPRELRPQLLRALDPSTGQCACLTTCDATDPRSSPRNPPWPRAPTTKSSAFFDSLINTSEGEPPRANRLIEARSAEGKHQPAHRQAPQTPRPRASTGQSNRRHPPCRTYAVASLLGVFMGTSFRGPRRWLPAGAAARRGQPGQRSQSRTPTSRQEGTSVLSFGAARTCAKRP